MGVVSKILGGGSQRSTETVQSQPALATTINNDDQKNSVTAALEKQRRQTNSSNQTLDKDRNLFG